MYNLLASLDLEQTIAHQSKMVVLAAAVTLAVLVAVAILSKGRLPKLQPVLFGLLAATLLLPTLFLASATVYLNVKSESGGPVHWHADFETWVCGQKFDLRDPKGRFNNKIGTPTLHEHNDSRIHLEGVAVNIKHDASVGKFMQVVGGEISQNSLVMPINEADAVNVPAAYQKFIQTTKDGPVVRALNSQQCNDQPATVQLFAFRFNPSNNTYTQTKVEQPETWVIAPESQVPPGDCLIIEFGPPKERTDKLCEQYGIRDKHRCQEFGVEASKKQLCDIEEVTKGGTDV